MTYGMQAAEGAIETLRPGAGRRVRASRHDRRRAADRHLRLRPHRPAGRARPRGPHDAEGRVRRPGPRARRATPAAGITFSRADGSAPGPGQGRQHRAASAILLRELGVDPRRGRPAVPRRRLRDPTSTPRNAIDIGFLAPVPVDRIEQGRQRLAARRAPAAPVAPPRARGSPSCSPRIEHLELETTPDFFELFVDALPVQAAARPARPRGNETMTARSRARSS